MFEAASIPVLFHRWLLGFLIFTNRMGINGSTSWSFPNSSHFLPPSPFCHQPRGWSIWVPFSKCQTQPSTLDWKWTRGPTILVRAALKTLHYTHTHTRTRTRAPSWLFHTARSREHGFSWQPLRPPAASGLQPNCTEEPGRSAGRLYSPPHPPHPHPWLRYQRKTRVQRLKCVSSPLQWKQKLSTKTHIPPACSC